MPARPIRVLALMEALSLTGPAKNLIEFACGARVPEDSLPPVEVGVVTYVRGPGARDNSFIRAVRAAGLEVHTIEERRAFDLGVLPRLRDVVERWHPDIVQTHNIKSHLLARLAGFGKSRPWVAFHHGYTNRSIRDRLYPVFDRYSLRGAYRVVTVCRPFARMIEGYGVAAEAIRIQHNSVRAPQPPATGAVAAVRATFGLPETEPAILAVGRISKEKGHRILVRAAAILRRERPELRLRVAIVGDGPLRAALEREAAAARLDNIVFCGQQRDVAPFYALAAAMALPSLSEGSPNVLLEAMAAGLPVAAASVGGVPEIATDGGTALLVPPEDPAALAEALGRLLADRALAARLGAAARAHVLAHFSPEEYRRSLMRFYRDLSPEGLAA